MPLSLTFFSHAWLRYSSQGHSFKTHTKKPGILKVHPAFSFVSEKSERWPQKIFSLSCLQCRFPGFDISKGIFLIYVQPKLGRGSVIVRSWHFFVDRLSSIRFQANLCSRVASHFCILHSLCRIWKKDPQCLSHRKYDHNTKYCKKNTLVQWMSIKRVVRVRNIRFQGFRLDTAHANGRVVQHECTPSYLRSWCHRTTLHFLTL